MRAYTMLGALILIWLLFHWQTDGTFLTPRNLSNLMLQTSVTGIFAVGMLMVIVAGQIDLSVGSVLGLAGGVAAIALTNWNYGLAPSILLAIAVGVVIGLIHGTLDGIFQYSGVYRHARRTAGVARRDQRHYEITRRFRLPTRRLS